MKVKSSSSSTATKPTYVDNMKLNTVPDEESHLMKINSISCMYLTIIINLFKVTQVNLLLILP